MTQPFPRRTFLASAAIVPGFAAAAGFGSEPEPATDPQPAFHPGFPRQDPALVREVVTVAHFNEKRLRELVDRHPALANASWDWGFGDWESPLGAASHMGNRPIADYLIQHGARVDIFAATMLGQIGVVKAMLAANPGVQRTPGPHGISLLAHAKAGGEGSAAVFAFLEALGDSSGAPAILPLSEAEAQNYLGAYAFGPHAGDRFVVKLDKGKLMLIKGDAANRPMHRVAEHEFFPAGVPSVRVRFAAPHGKASSFDLLDPERVLTATRIGG